MIVPSSKLGMAGAPVLSHTHPGNAQDGYFIAQSSLRAAFNCNDFLPSKMYFVFGNSDFIQSVRLCIGWGLLFGVGK